MFDIHDTKLFWEVYHPTPVENKHASRLNSEIGREIDRRAAVARTRNYEDVREKISVKLSYDREKVEAIYRSLGFSVFLPLTQQTRYLTVLAEGAREFQPWSAGHYTWKDHKGWSFRAGFLAFVSETDAVFLRLSDT